MKAIWGWLQRVGIAAESADENNASEEPAVPPALPPTRVVRLEALLAAQVSEDGRVREVELAESVGLRVDLEQIFAAAALAPLPGGWSIDRVRELIVEGYRREMRPIAIRVSVLEALKSDGVTVDALLDDTLRRDHALDVYAEAVVDRVARAQRGLDEEHAALSARIDELRARQQAIRVEQDTLQSGLSQWDALKVRVEAQWMDTLRLVLNPGEAPPDLQAPRPHDD